MSEELRKNIFNPFFTTKDKGNWDFISFTILLRHTVAILNESIEGSALHSIYIFESIAYENEMYW